MYSEEADIYFNSLKSVNSNKFQKNVDITLEKDEDGKTADPIRGINKKSKGRATYLKVVDPIREVNKRFKKSGIQKRGGKCSSLRDNHPLGQEAVNIF